VAVRPVANGRDLRRFIGLPYDLHRGDPVWVAPLRMDVAKLLSRKANPFFEHGDAQLFVAERDGGLVGRIAAIRNDHHGRYHPTERHVGFFGFFECVDDQAAADALFAAAADWLRGQGLTVMRGPASFTTNDECGLLVDGFDTPPVIMNPHNPRYYVPLVERAGFVKAMDLLCYEGSGDAPPARLVEASRKMAERFGITLRALDMKRFRDDVALIKRIYNRAWEANWGFIPATDAEIDVLAKNLKPVVVPDLVVFAFMKGELIGMGAAIPDFNAVLRHNRSGRLLPGLWHLLTKRKSIHRVRILILGVLPQYRRTGADALMYEWIWSHGNRLGYNWGEASWILENNPAMRNGLERMGFRVYKTLRMYDKAI
jgi:GNAT superfamily N-acetyltransferase